MAESVRCPSVFVVDDDEDIRDLARIVLELAGFAVVGEAADGRQALQSFFALDRASAESLVVLDDRMPGLSGLEVAEEILSRRPDQVVVLCSGDLDEAVTRRARDLGVSACVLKTDIAKLPGILRGLLAARVPAPRQAVLTVNHTDLPVRSA